MRVLAALLCLFAVSVHVLPESGVPQEDRRGQPIAVSLLLDNSPRTEPKRGVLRGAVVSFVRTMKPNDVAEVIEFSNDIKIRQRFTSNVQDLETAIMKTGSPSGRALYGAVQKGLQELEKINAQAGYGGHRLVLIVFTAGPDISSVIQMNQLLEFARRSSRIAVYGIATLGPINRETEFMLRQIAQITGGRAFFPQRVEDLASVYSQIGDELSGAKTTAPPERWARRVRLR